MVHRSKSLILTVLNNGFYSLPFIGLCFNGDNLKFFYKIWHPASPLWELVKNSVFSIFFIDIFDLTPLIIEFYCVFKKQNLKFFRITKNINLNFCFRPIKGTFLLWTNSYISHFRLFSFLNNLSIIWSAIKH